MEMRYDYSTVYLRNAKSAEDYLQKHKIPFTVSYDARLNQWSFSMELEKEDDFDKLVRYCGINSVRF